MNRKKLPKAIRSTPTEPDDPVHAAVQPIPTPETPVTRLPERTAPSEAIGLSAGDPRHAAAMKLVKRFSLWAGAAGLVPLPLLDIAAVGGLQIQMLRRISQIYGVPFSENRGKALIAGLAGTMIPATSVIGFSSVAKGIPVVGMAVGAFAMPALSASATYGIGMAFVQHFASGGSLLDFKPSDYREFLQAQKGAGRI